MIGLSRSISSSINISTFNLSRTTLPVSPESRSIISESHFPGHNAKAPLSPTTRIGIIFSLPAPWRTPQTISIVVKTPHWLSTLIHTDRCIGQVSDQKHLTGVTLGSNNAGILSNTQARHSHDAQRSFFTKDHHQEKAFRADRRREPSLPINYKTPRRVGQICTKHHRSSV